MATSSVGPGGGLVGPGGGLVGPDDNAFQQDAFQSGTWQNPSEGPSTYTLVPDAVAITVSVPLPNVARHLIPAPVAIPVVATTPAIDFPIVVTPDPVQIVVSVPVPYMAFAGRNDVRTSQAGLEAIYDTDPAAAISQAALEVAYDQQVPVHVSQGGLEVVYDQQVPVRVSQVGLEVIYLPGPSGRRAWATIID